MSGAETDPRAGTGSEADAMAVEWAAMAGIGAAGSADGGDLASEWASLAAVDGAGPGNDSASHKEHGPPAGTARPGSGNASGLGAIVNSSDISYERLPMLEVVFDRLERILTTSVRNFTSENVDVSLESVTAQRFGDYLNAVPMPAMIAVFRAVEWDNFGLITVDSPMIYSIVDVLLGGRRGSMPMRIEGRPYTTIEASLIERLVRLVLGDLGSAFAPITPIQFRFERMETNPRFAAIARPANAAILVRLRIDMEDRGGRIELLLPYATLEPIRKMLLQQFMGEKFGRDNIWESHLATELWGTQTEVRAVLDEQQIPLSRVLNLKVGETLVFNTNPDSLIELRSGSISLTRGRMGRRGQNIAVRVEHPLSLATKQAVTGNL